MAKYILNNKAFVKLVSTWAKKNWAFLFVSFSLIVDLERRLWMLCLWLNVLSCFSLRSFLIYGCDWLPPLVFLFVFFWVMSATSQLFYDYIYIYRERERERVRLLYLYKHQLYIFFSAIFYLIALDKSQYQTISKYFF